MMLSKRLGIIEPLIITVRGKRVILASDLAEIYGVQTRVLNQAVKRNPEKFPLDFMFQLTPQEVDEWRRSRSQSVILKRGSNIKYLPHVFTEHGAIMAANVLNSPRAVQMSVFVVRAFIKLREAIAAHQFIYNKLSELETRVGAHDKELQAIIAALRPLMAEPPRKKKSIGFGVRDARARYRKKESVAKTRRAQRKR
jgi:hypothetical protein